MAGRWRRPIPLILWPMTALMRKRSGRLKRKEKYFGIKSLEMLECLEQETEHRRNHCRTFKDLRLRFPILVIKYA